MKRTLIDLEDKRGQSNKTFGSKAPNSDKLESITTLNA